MKHCSNTNFKYSILYFNTNNCPDTVVALLKDMDRNAICYNMLTEHICSDTVLKKYFKKFFNAVANFLKRKMIFGYIFVVISPTVSLKIKKPAISPKNMNARTVQSLNGKEYSTVRKADTEKKSISAKNIRRILFVPQRINLVKSYTTPKTSPNTIEYKK